MIEFIFNLFAFARRLFLWMPPYLYGFIVTALNVTAIVLVISIAVKVASLGVNLLKTLMS